MKCFAYKGKGYTVISFLSGVLLICFYFCLCGIVYQIVST